MDDQFEGIASDEAARRLRRLQKSIDTVWPSCKDDPWTACDVQDYLADLSLIIDGDVE